MDILKEPVVLIKDAFIDILDQATQARQPNELTIFEMVTRIDTADEDYQREHLATNCGIDEDAVGFICRLG